MSRPSCQHGSLQNLMSMAQKALRRHYCIRVDLVTDGMHWGRRSYQIRQTIHDEFHAPCLMDEVGSHGGAGGGGVQEVHQVGAPPGPSLRVHAPVACREAPAIMMLPLHRHSWVASQSFAAAAAAVRASHVQSRAAELQAPTERLCVVSGAGHFPPFVGNPRISQPKSGHL